jgi:hypothetical protein
MSEDREPKGRIEALRGSLPITYSQDDLLQRRKGCGAPQNFDHQAPRDSAATMLRRHINTPYPALMALFLARIASKTDRSDQFAGRESTQYIVIVACGGETLAEDLYRDGAVLLRGLAKGARLAF